MLNIRLRFGGPNAGREGPWRKAERTLEGGVPLSQSCLWRLAAAQGDRAVDPRGAEAVARAIEVLVRGDGIDLGVPVDVLELSAGDGAFTRPLLDALDALGLGGAVRVVATDPDLRAAELLARDRAIRPRVREGRVDVARFDPLRDPLVAPLTRGEPITGPGVNPLVVLSHGALAALPSDLFRFDQGRISEALVVLVSPRSVPDPPRPEHLARLALSWEWRATDEVHYRDAALRAVLEELAAELDEGAVPVPVHAVRAVERLARLGGRAVFLAIESGAATLEAAIVSEAPADGVAVPANLDALTLAARAVGHEVDLRPLDGGLAAWCAFLGLPRRAAVVDALCAGAAPGLSLAARIEAAPGDPEVLRPADLQALRQLVAAPDRARRLAALLREAGDP